MVLFSPYCYNLSKQLRPQGRYCSYLLALIYQSSTISSWISRQINKNCNYQNSFEQYNLFLGSITLAKFEIHYNNTICILIQFINLSVILMSFKCHHSHNLSGCNLFYKEN